MQTRKLVATCVAGLCLWALVPSAAASLDLTLGIRETAAGGGAEVPIGGNAGTAGGIEWVNLDGQSVPFDDQWHEYTWDLAVDPLTAFAGATADGVLDGAYGSIEHLRFLNSGGYDGPITVWIDLVIDSFTPGAIRVQDFESYLAGDEVMFQEPSYSGSTSANIAAGSTSAVDDTVAYEGTSSCKVDWTFVDNDPARWLRLTTFNAPNGPNPLIRFDGGSVISLRIKAIPEPATALLLGAGLLLAGLRRRSA